MTDDPLRELLHPENEIPEIFDAIDWKQLPIMPSSEPLVPLGIGTSYPIFTSAIYFAEHTNSPYGHDQLEGSVITMFVRRTVAERLYEAQRKLPKGQLLVVLDAWRPLSVQRGLYEVYYNQLQQQRPLLGANELEAESRKYVCPPSDSSMYPPPHNTGGTVDVAVISVPKHVSEELNGTGNIDTTLARTILNSATMLDFGTPFDWGGSESALRYYEDLSHQRDLSAPETIALQNRRKLYWTMRSVGLIANPHEWWHFNAPQTQIGAKTIGLSCASFGPAELSGENKEHEAFRRSLVPTIGIKSRLQKAAICKPPDTHVKPDAEYHAAN